MHDALTTDENNTLTTEEHIIHLQDKWWVHDALATSCDTGTITSSQSHTTDALLSLRRWVASSKTRNSLHLKQSSRSCAHQPDMRAGCIDCHLLSEHNRWLSIKNLMQFNAQGDAFHQRASPDLAHWWWWLGICFGPEYAVMLSSTRIVHVLFWGQYQTKCLRRIYAANVNIYNPFTYFVTAVELSLFAKLPNIEHCCYCNRRDPKSTIAIGGI